MKPAPALYCPWFSTSARNCPSAPRFALDTIFGVTTSTIAPDRSSASLAVRYRPRRFSEVVGQRHVTTVLARAIASGRLPQQLLFSGGSGLGKTTLARVTAAALLCETPLDVRPGADACGVCANCVDITTPGRAHPDVIEFDAASHGGKDEIKQIADRAQLSPMRATRKVYIIDEVHGLSGPGGQAFLKLLEEPPAHVTFMLATTDPHKMLRTNRGRCTEFELLAPTHDELVSNLLRVALGEGWDLSTSAASIIVDASDAALGVRATLMSLEKLAGLLDEGADLSDAEVAAALGSTAPEIIARLIDALERQDAPDAFAALTDARHSASDLQIRGSLVEWARRGLLATSPATFDRDRWRLATVLDAPNTAGWTELVVARLVGPSAAPAPSAEVTTKKPASIKTSSPAKSVASDAPGTARTTDETIESFIQEVASNAPRAAALLRASDLTVSANVLAIAASSENAKALRACAEQIRTAAAKLNITAELRRPN